MGIRALKIEIYRICASLARVPRAQRLAVLRREIKRLPEDHREIALCLITAALATMEEPPAMQTWEKITMLAAGGGFLLMSLLIALCIPEPSGFQTFVFRVVLALAGSAFVCVLPGLLHLQGQVKSWVIRAGGALGVFLLIYTINPPRFLAAVRSSQGKGAVLESGAGVATNAAVDHVN